MRDTGSQHEGKGLGHFLPLLDIKEISGVGEFCISLPFYMLAKFPLLGSHSSKWALHSATFLMIL